MSNNDNLEVSRCLGVPVRSAFRGRKTDYAYAKRINILITAFRRIKLRERNKLLTNNREKRCRVTVIYIHN